MATLTAPINDVELLLVRQRKAKLLRQKVAAIKNDGLPFYRPHPKQDIFHSSSALRRATFTGNRWGKSTCGVAEDAAWLRNERIWYKQRFDILNRDGSLHHTHDGSENHPFVRQAIPQRPVKGLVMCENWDKVDEIFTSERGEEGKLWKYLPRDGFVKRKTRNHEGKICIVECANGSILRFATVKSWLNDPRSIESSDWDWIHVDEPIPEGMWKGASRGLVDRNGAAWFNLTALSEPWITDAFLPGGTFEGQCFKVEGSIYDNPYLKPEGIAMFEASLTEEEKDCRLMGKPLHLAGLVYKEFKYDKHVLQTLPKGWLGFDSPPKDWSYYYYIDPHPRIPHCVLFLAVDPFQRLYFFTDLFERCKPLDLCKLMHGVLNGCNVIHGRCDPIAFIEDPETEHCWADDFAQGGFPCEKAVKDPMRGISRVQQRLAENPPSIFFSPSCRRALWEIQRWPWMPEKNKPRDEDDHAMECLYRAILDEPCYVPLIEKSRPIRDEVIDRPQLDLGKFSMSI